MKLTVCFVLFFSVLVALNEANSGAKVRVTSKGLRYVAEKLLNLLSKTIKTVKIPEVNHQGSDLKIRMYNTRITSYIPPNVDISIANDAIQLKCTGGHIGIDGTVNAKKKVLFVWLSATPDFNLKVTNVNFFISVKVGRDPSTNKPVLKDWNVNVGLGNLDVDFKGSWYSFILNWFSSVVESKIKDFLEPTLVNLVKTTLSDKTSELLGSIKTTVEASFAGYDFIIDYGLATDPIHDNTGFEVAVKGLFQRPGGPVYPYQCHNFNVPNSVGYMAHVAVSDCLFNSLLYAAEQTKFLGYEFSYNILPPTYKGIIADLVSQLFPVFDKEKCDIITNVKTTDSYPTVVVTDVVTVQFRKIYVKISTLCDNNVKTAIVNTTVDFNVNIGGPSISASKLFFSTATVTDLSYEKEQSDASSNLIQKELEGLSTAALSFILGQGIPLPLETKYVTVQNLKVFFTQATLAVSSDVLVNIV